MLFDKYVFRGDCATVENHGETTITGPCYYCKAPQTVIAKKTDLDRFRDGVFAQDCFSYLSAEEREFLISGICGKCWDELFSTEDEEETE
jgi:hypothetical protein